MLAERVKEWTKKWKEEGLQQGMQQGMHKGFATILTKQIRVGFIFGHLELRVE